MKTRTNKKVMASMFALLCSIFCVNAQTLQWASHYTTDGYNQGLSDVHIGGDGRIYVCGDDEVSSASYDALIISYTASGTQNWTATYAGSAGYGDYFAEIATYGTGSSIAVYAAGHAYMTFNDDALLVKYNQSGTQQWAATWNNSGYSQDWANCISVDGSGNIYICGRSSANGGDLFVLKYNSSGTLQWSATYNSSGTQDDAPQFMKINAAGTYLYITSVRTISSTNHDAVLQKISTSTGAISWTQPWDNTLANDIDETYSLDLDNDENIYVAGKTQTASNGSDALVLTYNSSGTLLAANTWNNSSHNLDEALASIDVTQATHTPLVYVTGYTQINVASNDADYLTIKYSGVNPTPLWTNTYDGTGTGCPQANDDLAYMIMADAVTGKVYVTGRSFETGASLNATTIKYNSGTGVQEWIDSYDRANNANMPASKYPMDMQYDGCYFADQVYIASSSYESATAITSDATTLKYGYSGMCVKMANPNLAGNETPAIKGVVYPNPFNSTATFETDREDISNASFVIYDMTGRLVKRIDNISASKFEVDSKELNTGLYFYRFIQDNEIILSGRFGIEK